MRSGAPCCYFMAGLVFGIFSVAYGDPCSSAVPVAVLVTIGIALEMEREFENSRRIAAALRRVPEEEDEESDLGLVDPKRTVEIRSIKR